MYVKQTIILSSTHSFFSYKQQNLTNEDCFELLFPIKCDSFSQLKMYIFFYNLAEFITKTFTIVRRVYVALVTFRKGRRDVQSIKKSVTYRERFIFLISILMKINK